MMHVSILDIHPPIYLPDVVELAEESGYHRYWVTEHHSPMQSASPTLAMALAGGISERLRIGVGGVLLRLHQPLRVAGDIALLRTFYPGRVDVGIAGALASDARARALSGEPAAGDATFQARIEELIRLSTADAAVPCSALVRDEAPQFWLCGTSSASAALAGNLGLRYAYHHHLKPLAPERRADIGAVYRDAFRPSAVTTAPYFAIAAYGAVASTAPRAVEEWRGVSGATESPSFAGDSSSAADQICQLAGGYGADEIFIDCFSSSLAVRLEGLRAIADALRLSEPHAQPLTERVGTHSLGAG